jgi:hypothetical protein
MITYIFYEVVSEGNPGNEAPLFRSRAKCEAYAKELYDCGWDDVQINQFEGKKKAITKFRERQ